MINADPDPIPNPEFWLPYQRLKKIYSCKFFLFFGSKIATYLSLGLQKDAQATGETFSHQKRTSSTSKHENSILLFFISGSFLPSWIRIRIQQLKLMRIHADPDPQPCIEDSKYENS